MAMSGGIDSTMASLLLHEEGYEVIGLTMKTWDYESSGGSKKETGCCSLDSINDARQLAVDCGFPHTILIFEMSLEILLLIILLMNILLEERQILVFYVILILNGRHY